MNLTEIDKSLRETYKLPRRLFGLPQNAYGTEKWRIRRVIANVIVGGSRERSALKAVEQIFANFTFNELAFPRTKRESNRFDLIHTILEENDIRWAPKKAANILKVCQLIKENFDGKVPESRNELESLPGIGKHAATVIRARAFGHTNEFAVDLHVRRIAKRMGLVNEKATDRTITQAFESASEKPAHLSYAFVRFGQTICRYHPSCKKCKFNQYCPKKKHIK